MEEKQQIQAYQKTLLPFDPVILFRDAIRKWALILVIALICGMAAYVYTDTGYVPRYRTEATLVLTTRDSASTVYTNLDSTVNLAMVFTEILNSSVMRNSILKELGMDSFSGSIYASAIESTNLLTVQVTALDPRTAFQVIDVLLKNHEAVTYSVMGDIVLEVLEPPVVPVRPYNAVNVRSAFQVATAGVAVVLFILMVVISYFKDVIRSKDEAEQKLDCWCLGEIYHERKQLKLKDWLRKRKRSILITHPETGFRYVTTMSKLSRRVEQHMDKHIDKHMKKGKIVMVTSVMENEGKSTVAANLALSMAKKYEKVLLIDLDLHKPACRKVMDQPKPEHYTHDVIQGNVSLKEAVKTDKLSRMDMLLAMRCDPQLIGELIHSAGLERMLQQAREAYDYVVIDLPPMALVSDPEAVMELVDGSILVIRQNGVRTPDLNRAIRDLQRGKAKLLGCVLNNVFTTATFSGEGYGVGYGRYGGYGKYGKYGKYGRYAAYATKQNLE